MLAHTKRRFLFPLPHLLAVLGSFIVLTAAQHIRQGNRLSWLNVVAADTALNGIGVWAMHFTGMQALHLDMEPRYSIVETLASLIAAVGASSGALAFVANEPSSCTRLLNAGVTQGLGCSISLDNRRQGAQVLSLDAAVRLSLAAAAHIPSPTQTPMPE